MRPEQALRRGDEVRTPGGVGKFWYYLGAWAVVEHDHSYLVRYPRKDVKRAEIVDPPRVKALWVVITEPGTAAGVREIDNNLAALQALVGGCIEVVPLSGGLLLICNEEGKLAGLPVSMFYGQDPIAGPAIICRDVGEDLGSLTDAQARVVLAQVAHTGAIQ